MEIITKTLQNNLKNIVNVYKELQRESAAIYNDYFKTDANSTVTGLTNSTDPATVTYHLTKEEYTNGITLCEHLKKLFNNEVVSQSDYRQNAIRVKYGSAADLGSILSNATEEIGKRLYALCVDLLDVYDDSKNNVEIYYDNEINDMIANIDNQRVIPGSNMTKDDLSSIITLCEQINNFVENSAVTQGDYSETVAKWERLGII